MNDLAKKIKVLRKQNDMTLEDVAKIVGVGKSTVRKWETGMIENMKLDKISSLAVALKTTPSFLMGWDDDVPPDAIPVVNVPIYGSIPAGYPNSCVEELIGYQPVNVSHPEEYFCLVVHGDSMIGKGIVDNSIVLIHKQPFADNGQIVACRVNGYESTLKIFQKNDDVVVLSPANSNYQPIIVSSEQFISGYAEIYGVVKKVIIDL